MGRTIDTAEPAAEWFTTRRSVLLGALGVAALGAGAGAASAIWTRKDMTARLFNPFAIDHFELEPVPGLTRADGSPMPGLSSADLAGRRSILNVWASWCPGCRAEHPALMALAARNLAPVYGALVKDRPERARAFLARHGNPFVAVGDDSGSFLMRALGMRGVPGTFVVGPGPKIEVAVFEPLDEEMIATRLLPALTKAG